MPVLGPFEVEPRALVVLAHAQCRDAAGEGVPFGVEVFRRDRPGDHQPGERPGQVRGVVIERTAARPATGGLPATAAGRVTATRLTAGTVRPQRVGCAGAPQPVRKARQVGRDRLGRDRPRGGARRIEHRDGIAVLVRAPGRRLRRPRPMYTGWGRTGWRWESRQSLTEPRVLEEAARRIVRWLLGARRCGGRREDGRGEGGGVRREVRSAAGEDLDVGLARTAQPREGEARPGPSLALERDQLGMGADQGREQGGWDGIGPGARVRAARGAEDAMELESVEHGRRACFAESPRAAAARARMRCVAVIVPFVASRRGLALSSREGDVSLRDRKSTDRDVLCSVGRDVAGGRVTRECGPSGRGRSPGPPRGRESAERIVGSGPGESHLRGGGKVAVGDRAWSSRWTRRRVTPPRAGWRPPRAWPGNRRHG